MRATGAASTPPDPIYFATATCLLQFDTPNSGSDGTSQFSNVSMSLLQKSDGSPDPPNRQSEALEMTEIWPPEGATAHFLAVSMCRVTLDTAVDTFATGSYVRSQCGSHATTATLRQPSTAEHRNVEVSAF